MSAVDLAAGLPHGLATLAAADLLMMAVGMCLIGLAIAKRYEPTLLLPIGFGCLVANLPQTSLTHEAAFLSQLYAVGIPTELFPLLVFLGIGAMVDFTPLLAQPGLLLLGVAGQIGIFGTLLLALGLGFPLNEAASIGVIGAIDGPTSIFVTAQLAPHLLGPVAVAAYSYMSLVPVIQPPLMRLLTSRSERQVRMLYTPRPVSYRARVAFPIVVTLVVGLLVPESTPLISMLMLGNLLRESGVVERLATAAANEIVNIATLFLGLAIGATMTADAFLRPQTLVILALGLLAFCLDTVGGLLLGKLACAASRRRINPLLGAAGISAFPMAARLAAQLAQDEDRDNFLLMHATAANTGGQIASIIAGGVLLSLVLRLT